VGAAAPATAAAAATTAARATTTTTAGVARWPAVELFIFPILNAFIHFKVGPQVREIIAGGLIARRASAFRRSQLFLRLLAFDCSAARYKRPGGGEKTEHESPAADLFMIQCSSPYRL
jgi:hypothetical protein